MKKILYILIITVIISVCIFFLFKKNIPYAIDISPDITVEKILDPYSNINNERLYYISDDKGFFNVEIENELNTKSISWFNSTSYKSMTTITKEALLSKMSKQIISVYYHNSEWYSFDSVGDSCVAILRDNDGQNYIVGIQQISLCKK